MTGVVRRILVRPSARTPLREIDDVLAVEDQGLEGDHAVGGRRQVTLLDLDRWREVCEEIGRDVDPAERRANLLIEGLPLDLHRDAELQIGEAVLRIGGETRPCELIDERTPGLSQRLRADRRGGLYGRIVRGGRVAVGDLVRWLDGPLAN